MKEWLKSVYSDSTRHFVSNPYPRKYESITISLQMRENDEITDVFLRFREFGIEQLRRMECRQENNLLVYSATVDVRDNRFHYQFYLVTKKQIYYYTQFRITDYIPDEEQDFVIVSDMDAPTWVQDCVFYQIFPERFCNGNPKLSVKDGEYSYQGYETIQVKDWDTPAALYQYTHNLDFYGGDLDGIISKLDYLQDLGVNAIYLNPIFASPSVHKYDSLDYFTIDPHLGGDEALVRLSEAIHKRGMKLMMDISINHTSSDAKWFNKSGEFYDKKIGAYHNPSSPERGYYFFNEDNSYDSWCGTPTMPKMDFSSEKLRDIIYRTDDSVLKKWIHKPYNIDAWRFDVADCFARNQIVDVHGEVLEELRKELKGVKEDLYILAEDWADCADDLQGNRWDATMNYYGCARPIREFLGENDLFNERNEELAKKRNRLTAKQLASRIVQFYTKLPGAIQYQLFNLLDSHDVTRVHNDIDVNQQEYLGAVMTQFALPGVPSVYYGDEIEIAGGLESIEQCRFPMNWHWEESPKSITRHQFYKRLISLRRRHEALIDGGFRILSEAGYTLSFARFTKDELVVVIFSTDTKDSEVYIDPADFGFCADSLKNLVCDEDDKRSDEFVNCDMETAQKWKNVSTHTELEVSRDYFATSVVAKKKDTGILVSIPAHQSYLFVWEK